MNTVIFTQRVEKVDGYNECRDQADQNIVRFLEACGYLPIAISNVISDVKLYIETLHPIGIVLTGGNSLVKYGGNAPERDRIDYELIRLSIENKIPLYGFCRGMQSILDYFECDLLDVKNHVAVRHKLLKNLIGREVNSYHNQGIYSINVKAPLKVLAETVDGIAESVEYPNKNILGVMWHPEREREFCQEDINMVRKLFDISR